MSIYQICQGTRLHSRATQRISHRIRLTFTSLTEHTHTVTDVHNFSNISCRALTVSCLSTRAQTARAPATSIKQQEQQRIAAMATDTGLLDITQLYELPKIHIHKIYRYPIEHAKFSPTYPYIRYVKGHALIREYRTELDQLSLS